MTGLSILGTVVVDAQGECNEDHCDDKDEEERLRVEWERLLLLLPDLVCFFFLQ